MSTLTSPVPSKSRKRLLGRAAEVFASAMDTRVSSYLARRGLDEPTVAGAQLGLVTDLTGFEQYEGRLSIPYLTPGGVVGMRFRCLAHEDCKKHGCPKYLGIAGDETHLYNVADLQSAGEIAVTEGELDALILSSRCDLPAVGVPGAQAWASYYRRLLDGYDRVWVFGDGDDAGRAFAREVAGDLVNGVVVPMPRGQDVTSLFVEGGSQAINDILVSFGR